jgi:nucleotide-binding universal stress UspA family protein
MTMETTAASPRRKHPGAHATTSGKAAAPSPAAISRIAVGIDGFPEGQDAAALGAAIARLTGAHVMLVAVHSAPLFPVPGWDWRSLRKEADRTLGDVRRAFAPGARTVAETDVSIPRALHRVVRREHRDLLVLGSSRQAPDGHVRIGKRTRQLLSHFECALAIAPRGMHSEPDIQLKRIGVGYDGGPESEAALELAGSMARAGAELQVRAVVDDRVPMLLRSALGGLVATEWADVIAEKQQRLHDQALAAAKATGATLNVEVLGGRPADALLALSGEVDLLVIGSRRWGPTARVLLGSTGEALLQDAACPVLAVPRPQG